MFQSESESSEQESSSVKRARCLHCGQAVFSPSTAPFCCTGCAFVYKNFQDFGLEKYYGLREQLGELPGAPPTSSHLPSSYFDSEIFHEEYVTPCHSGGECESAEVTFSVSGIHCAACVWVLEKIPSLLDGVLESKVDYGRALLRIRFVPAQVRLSAVAELLSSLGYPASPPQRELERQRETREQRRSLLRLGVAAVTAGNTMILAVSLYEATFSGMEEHYRLFFQLLSLGVALPAVTYAALPFYRAALAGLLVGKAHLDLPLSLGIVASFLLSAYNAFSQQGEVYFESVTMLVFLLLCGRYLQSQLLRKARAESASLRFLLPLVATRLEPGSPERRVTVPVELVKPGERVVVSSGGRVPVDGRLASPQAILDESILTGEVRPREARAGEMVSAGTVSVGPPIELTVESVGENTRVGALLQQLGSGDFSEHPYRSGGSRLSGLFTGGVLLASFLTFFGWAFVDVQVALNNTVALLIVSCPCALALSTPLAVSAAIAQGIRRGFIVLQSGALFHLSSIRRIFLDKTGTLTTGSPEVQSFVYTGEREEYEYFLAATVAAEQQVTKTPVGSALLRWARRHGTDEIFSKWSFPPEEISLHQGRGVSLATEQGVLRIGSLRWGEQFVEGDEQRAILKAIEAESLNSTVVLFLCSGRILGYWMLEDPLRSGMANFVRRQREKERTVTILSGDRQETVEAVAEEVGISRDDAYGGLTPECKQEFIEAGDAKETVMIGDGYNDAPALRSAAVGVAVRGGMEASVDIADLYLTTPSAESFEAIFVAGDRLQGLLRRNYTFSLVYNVLASAAAIGGYMSPLFAAVAMPISSLLIVASCAMTRFFPARGE
ncbi:heavy metal translocating P-type ATPase [bacterium]|nr:heavy metal translocating P-type ATPase [bacterium]